MTMGATLDHLHLGSPDPAACARFYADVYAMDCADQNGQWICEGNGRKIIWSQGTAGELKHAQFLFENDESWITFATRHGHDKSGLMTTVDPDGNTFVFAPPGRPALSHPVSEDLPQAYLQHFAIRTPDVAQLVAFYEQIGFVVSDRVYDATQRVKACFMRSSDLHHVMAIFEAPVACFDHQSFETDDWHGLKVWADHMVKNRIDIVWGIGRHGPGNDVFFMVRDPDGNLAEISAEIEVCPPDRPAGIWPHEERTLNVWGKAIMRS